jgi:ribosomal protein L21E
VITDVDARTITVARDGGGQVIARVGTRTHVIVHGEDREADTDYLRPGMRVRFRLDDRVLDRVHVTDVPPGTAPPARGADAGREIKARLLDIGRGGAFRADVAGRPQEYRTKDPAMLRSFEKGDLVILTFDPDSPDLVAGVRSAARTGRVLRLDPGARQVVVEVDGREEVYELEEGQVMRRLREGETIRFEVEERTGGRRVITAVVR